MRKQEKGMRPARQQAGFTLIELLVVVAIMVVVSAIILANNNKFGGQVLLQNFAYDVALSVRQAQVYGISVERFGSGASSNFTAGYGIHFDISSPTSYLLFADAITRNGEYDCPTPGVSCELVTANTINRGYQVSQLCYTPAGGSEVCNSSPAGTPKTLDILFIRPEPDALITACGPSCATSCLLTPSSCAQSARVTLRAPQGQTMSVSVTASGQISVDQTVAP